jgi:hypothetical protein
VEELHLMIGKTLSHYQITGHPDFGEFIEVPEEAP